MSTRMAEDQHTDSFRHDALFYAGDGEFVAACADFVRDGLRAGEPVLVAVVPRKIHMLTEELGDDASRVLFVDMAKVGRNPARIIPVWHDFISSRPDGAARVRGIGEPIWAERTGEEIVEAQRHEALINLAFHDAEGWILCPYDTRSLSDPVLEEAYRSHPYIEVAGSRHASMTYLSLNEVARSLDRPLPPPAGDVETMLIEEGTVADARSFVQARGSLLGMPADRIDDLKLVATELAANSLVHGGGNGLLRFWSEGGDVVLEVIDGGLFDEPLAGRRAPNPLQEGGRGMWIVNQLCDLVQIRTLVTGSVIRIRMSVV
ncbi:MAG TPA: sensor histidine kinase [Actinomycetota bacterium]|nr:sensor histidine kinase [Actinomycetota bacterium]